jgi:hypothetical protein
MVFGVPSPTSRKGREKWGTHIEAYINSYSFSKNSHAEHEM